MSGGSFVKPKVFDIGGKDVFSEFVILDTSANIRGVFWGYGKDDMRGRRRRGESDGGRERVSRIGLLEVADCLWGVREVVSGFPRIVIGGVPFPVNFIKRFSPHGFEVGDVVNFIFWGIVDEYCWWWQMHGRLRRGRRSVGGQKVFVKDRMET